MRIEYEINEIAGVPIFIDVDDGPVTPSDILTRMSYAFLHDKPGSFDLFASTVIKAKSTEPEDEKVLRHIATPISLDANGFTITITGINSFYGSLNELLELDSRQTSMLKAIFLEQKRPLPELLRLLENSVSVSTIEEFSGCFENYIREKHLAIAGLPMSVEAYVDWAGYAEYMADEYKVFQADTTIKFAIKRTILQGADD